MTVHVIKTQSRVASATVIPSIAGSHFRTDERGPPRFSITPGVQGKPRPPSQFSTTPIVSSPPVITTPASSTDKASVGIDLPTSESRIIVVPGKDDRSQDSNFASEVGAPIPNHSITAQLTVTAATSLSSIHTAPSAPSARRPVSAISRSSFSSTTATSDIPSTSLSAVLQAPTQPSQTKASASKVIPITISLTAAMVVVTLVIIYLIRKRYKRRDEGHGNTVVQQLSDDLQKPDHILDIDPLTSSSMTTLQKYIDNLADARTVPIRGGTPGNGGTPRRMSHGTVRSIPSSAQRYIHNIGIRTYPTGGDASVAGGTPRKISWGTISSTQSSAQRLKMEFPLDDVDQTPVYRSTLSYLSFMDDGNRSGPKYC